MKREGLAIEGFCVAAGIPSTENAAEIIGALRDVGIKHAVFKPGYHSCIRQNNSRHTIPPWRLLHISFQRYPLEDNFGVGPET